MKLIKGYTYMHEHLFIDLSSVKNDKDCLLDCSDEIINELKQCYQLGLRNIVEVTNRGMGRNMEVISRVEKETGINVIKSTGYYKEPFLPTEVETLSIEELAQIMTKELTLGIETGTVASVIGEIGTSLNEWKQNERKLFDAAIIAQKATKAPIYTHTTLGTLAKEQADYLIKNGVSPQKIIIGHIDLCQDLDIIFDVLKTGVTVGFDTIGKNDYFPDTKRIEFLIEIEKAGLISQVVMSQDLTRKSHLEYLGGIGYGYMLKTFIPLALKMGLSQTAIDVMLCENPQRIFANDYEL